MVNESFLILVLSFVTACYGIPSGYTGGNEEEHWEYTNPVNAQTGVNWAPTPIFNDYVTSQAKNYAPDARRTFYNAHHKNSKKSELPEKGQIKFMKHLLGKVRTLLNQSKSTEAPVVRTKPEKKEEQEISDVSSNNGNLYRIVKDNDEAKEKQDEKSVNVISIPLDALGKITKSGHSNLVENSPIEMLRPIRTQNGDVVLRRVPQSSENEDGDNDKKLLPSNSEKTPFVPVMLQGEAGKLSNGATVILDPQTQTMKTFQSDQIATTGDPLKPLLPTFLLQHHGAITKHKDDESLYRDIGHIPGQMKFVDDQSDFGVGKTSLRHRRPGNRLSTPFHLHPHGGGSSHKGVDFDDDADDDYDNDNDDDEDEDDDDDDDEDDDEDDEDDDEKYNGRMRAEQRQIAATRRKLFEMLPGNDPTYTSENKGLGLGMMRAVSQMPVPEAFLGNPMLRGTGFGQSQNMLPFMGAAMVGEHADNAADRGVFMLGSQGQRQVFGDSQSNARRYNDMQPPAMKVSSGGFSLGGSPAEAMSPNEVNFLLQKPAPADASLLSQKDRISRPKALRHRAANVLLKVNGRPIGDSNELRSHIVNGVMVKGREKIIKSKGPVNVKITKARDGVHSKVVDITSSKRVKILEAKSKIAKSHSDKPLSWNNSLAV